MYLVLRTSIRSFISNLMSSSIPSLKTCVILSFSLFLSLGCSSTRTECSRNLRLTWADTQQITQDIRVLTSPEFEGRKTGTLGAEKTRHYLITRFNAIGLTPWQDQFEHSFSYQKGFTLRQGSNVVGIKTAATPTNEWRILVAHYDHLGKKGSTYYPGADDNASGIAALLQIAEQAVKEKLTTNLIFAAVDAEESGLYGSQALVEQLKASGGLTPISLVLNLDMIGNPGRRKLIYLEGANSFPHFQDFYPLLNQTTGLCIRKGHPKPMGMSVARTDWLKASDHYSFHKVDVPWLYFGVPVHNQYHEPSDKLTKLDINFIAAVSETSFQLLQLNRHYFNK